MSFHSNASQHLRMNAVTLNRHVDLGSRAYMNGKVVEIVPADGRATYVRQIGIGYRRVMSDWCNEFNHRSQNRGNYSHGRYQMRASI